MTPCLAVMYSPAFLMATCPSDEAVLTMAPPPLDSIAITWYLMHQKTLVKSTLIARSHCSVVSSCKGTAHCSTPALLNAPSNRPYVETAFATSACTSLSRARSALTKAAVPPLADTASTVPLPASSLISVTSTLAPAADKTRQAARPIPPPAPVTMRDLPRRIPAILFSIDLNALALIAEALAHRHPTIGAHGIRVKSPLEMTGISGRHVVSGANVQHSGSNVGRESRCPVPAIETQEDAAQPAISRVGVKSIVPVLRNGKWRNING